MSSTNQHFIPSLDGIRSLAILIVFLAHSGVQGIPGGLGVTIFFFLSGYLITTLLEFEYNKNGAINLKNFYMRRILRIWPVFYTVLFLGALLTYFKLLSGEIFAKSFIAQLLHYANYYSIFNGSIGVTEGTEVFWSLAVEEHFYLIFPFIFILLKNNFNKNQQVNIIIFLLVLILLWRFYLICYLNVSSFRTYYASDTRADSILFGCLLAIYNNPALEKNEFNEHLYKMILVPVATIILFGTLIFRNEIFRETLRYTMQGIALMPIFIAAIKYPNWGLFKILNYKIAKWLGVLSYSFYLVHFTILKAVGTYLPNTSKLLIGTISFLLTLVLAQLLYLLVEKKFAKLRHKFK